MDLETATFELQSALKKAGVIVDGNLELVNNTNNVSFSDNKKVFVKVLGNFETSPKYLVQEHYIALTHSKIMKPLLRSPLTVNLSSGEKLYATAWNYVKHTPRKVKDLKASDGYLIGQELLDFYATRPVAPLDINSGWTTKKSKPTLDVPTDVSILMNYLSDVVMDNLNKVSSEMVGKPKVLIHGDPHKQNMLWLGKDIVRLIDFESSIYEYVECDLACLYQSFVQINNRLDIYENILSKVEEQFSVNQDLLFSFIQARNFTATRFMTRTGKWDIVEQNLNNVYTHFLNGTLVPKIYLP